MAHSEKLVNYIEGGWCIAAGAAILIGFFADIHTLLAFGAGGGGAALLIGGFKRIGDAV